ncbi:hypothetical protein JCM16358_00360 [Halanaerocella petrolearia]
MSHTNQDTNSLKQLIKEEISMKEYIQSLFDLAAERERYYQ